MSTDTLERLPRAMTIAEFAAELQVSERLVYEMCRDGRLKATRMGRRWILSRLLLTEILGESAPFAD